VDETHNQFRSFCAHDTLTQLKHQTNVWYREEEGGGVDETHNPFTGDEALFQKREAELQKRMTRRDGSVMSLAQSKRASEVQKDINAWEENRLFTSGVVRAREVRTPFRPLQPQHFLAFLPGQLSVISRFQCVGGEWLVHLWHRQRPQGENTTCCYWPEELPIDGSNPFRKWQQFHLRFEHRSLRRDVHQ